MSDTEVKPDTDQSQGQMAAANNAKQVFVAKLPVKVTKKELEHLFDRYGNVVDVNIKKNFAFIVARSYLSCSKKSLRPKKPSSGDTTTSIKE